MRRDGISFSQRERLALADLLADLGPDVPTLCEGWRSADLAAHLVTRDRRPDAVPGMVVAAPPLARWTERVMQRARDTTTWATLVDQVRGGPPPWIRPLDPFINAVEYFVHHEDLRRAQAGWEPRPLRAADEALLWRQMRLMRFVARSAASRLEAPGLAPITVAKGGRGPVVKGAVGELVLWVSGRKEAARVETGAA
jgi:uncharacterized protein (TIGR03085 family)